MARKIKAKLVLKLRAAGHSRNEIAKSQGMAKKSVFAVFDAADELGIAYEDIAELDDDVYRRLFPDRHRTEDVFTRPDWGYVHKELGKTGVTLVIIHAEYVDQCRQSGGVFMSCQTFCRGYQEYTSTMRATSRVERKAERSVEVGWALPVNTGNAQPM